MANDIFQLNVLASCAGQFAENVFHYQATSGSPVTDPETTALTLANNWIAANEGFFTNCIPTDATIIGVKCKRINNGGGPTAMVPLGDAGTGVGASIDTSSGACALWPYSNGSRYFTARTFIPFLAEGAYVANEIQSSYQTNVTQFINALLVHITVSAIQYALCVYSKKHKVAFNIQGSGISLKIGTQRKRLTPIM